MCPFGNSECINTSVILSFYRKWRPHYTWQPEQGTQKWPNICSRTKPKSMPRPRWVLEVGRILGYKKFKCNEVNSILMRDLATVPVAQRFLVIPCPLHWALILLCRALRRLGTFLHRNCVSLGWWNSKEHGWSAVFIGLKGFNGGYSHGLRREATFWRKYCQWK